MRRRVAIIALCSGVGLPLFGNVAPAKASASVTIASPAEFARNPQAYPERLYLQPPGFMSKPSITPSSSASTPQTIATVPSNPASLLPPVLPSNSFYELNTDLTYPNYSAIQAQGYNEPNESNGQTITLFVGAPCGTYSIQTYGGGCMSDGWVAYAIESFLYGYTTNMQHVASGAVNVVVATNNSSGINNGSDFYSSLAGYTYQYASYLNSITASTNPSHFVLWAGDDLETPWNSPSVSLPELQSYNAADLAGTASIPMLDVGQMFNTCSSASCWDSPSDHGWSMHQIYDANWGGPDVQYDAEFPGPQIFASSWSSYYADMDSAANAVGVQAPSYQQVIYGCGVSSETNAYTTYADFFNATSQRPTYTTNRHVYGDDVGSAC